MCARVYVYCAHIREGVCALAKTAGCMDCGRIISHVLLSPPRQSSRRWEARNFSVSYITNSRDLLYVLTCVRYVCTREYVYRCIIYCMVLRARPEYRLFSASRSTCNAHRLLSRFFCPGVHLNGETSRNNEAYGDWCILHILHHFMIFFFFTIIAAFIIIECDRSIDPPSAASIRFHRWKKNGQGCKSICLSLPHRSTQLCESRTVKNKC